MAPSLASLLIGALLACAASAEPDVTIQNLTPCRAVAGVWSNPFPCYTNGVTVPISPGATIHSWPGRLAGGAQCVVTGADATLECDLSTRVVCQGSVASQWAFNITANADNAGNVTSCAVV